MKRLAALVLALAACRRAPAPVTAQDCQAACKALAAVGCAIGTDARCPAFLLGYSTDGDHRNPATGKPLTCADAVAIKMKSDAQRIGFGCP